MHVDDGLLLGSGECYEASQCKLQKRTPLKIWRNQGFRSGRTVAQNPKTHDVDLTLLDYFDDVEPIPFDKCRRAHPEAELTALSCVR